MTSGKPTTKATSRIAARGPGGRIAKFVPTAEHRQLVQNLAACANTPRDIRLSIPWGRPSGKPIDEKTFAKHFALELQRGSSMSRVRVIKRLHDAAMDGNVTAMIFFLKTQCGWSETVKVEQTGKDGAPLAGPVLYLPAKDQQSETVEAATVDRRAPRQQAERFAVPTMSDLPPDPAGSDQEDPEHRHAFGSVRATTFYPAAADPLRKVGTR